jgi:hypothetical protein
MGTVMNIGLHWHSKHWYVFVSQFQELEYELRRQAGSAYVGQRLAKGTPHQDNPEQGETQDGASPHKLASSTTTQQTDLDTLPVRSSNASQIVSWYSIVI